MWNPAENSTFYDESQDLATLLPTGNSAMVARETAPKAANRDAL